jgi:hypothetical protein
MSSWRADIEDALQDFMTVATLAGSTIGREHIVVQFSEAPHEPPRRLPEGKMAVYGFWYDGEWLKIGKAGPKELLQNLFQAALLLTSFWVQIRTAAS